ncbi:MAG: hypothetical protein IKM02_05405 [Clostridia bacterium]|nr:hypothetical protein [Clostridia bacterium]
MTFLALMLSSLYEPEEQSVKAHCAPHPIRPHEEISSSVIDYAADMTIALTYHKCLDDWSDEKKITRRLYGDLLKKSYDRVKTAWPNQCHAIEEALSEISRIEQSDASLPDEALVASGRLMSELFVLKDDFWAQQLRWFGASLGRFIYLMDAAMDYEQDRKKGCYNPLLRMNLLPERTRDLLMLPLGEASEAFERLPLVQDEHLLRSILYSGVWQDYNEKMKKKTEDTADGH